MMGIKPKAAATLLAAALCGLAVSAAAATPADGRDNLARVQKGTPAEQKAAIDAGRKVAQFCANCHGEQAGARYAELPNLAGQHPIYLLNQLEVFRTGRRLEPFMQGLGKALSADEKASVAYYYANLPATPSVTTPGPRSAEGGQLFARNCVRCHGPEAHGGENFPRLAGQQPEYLRQTLKRYLKGGPERIYPPMTAAVMALGEQNIEAVVAYLSSLK
ncbi:MAG: cytochrome c4 [Zoogloea sp.]|nr:cytochrome c4 [Zoogloea sp.]